MGKPPSSNQSMPPPREPPRSAATREQAPPNTDTDDEAEDTEDTDYATGGATSSGAASSSKDEAFPQKQERAVGAGSQRVRNKDTKNEIKKKFYATGWGDKPAWITWKAVHRYVLAGIRPPATRVKVIIDPLQPTRAGSAPEPSQQKGEKETKQQTRLPLLEAVGMLELVQFDRDLSFGLF